MMVGANGGAAGADSAWLASVEKAVSDFVSNHGLALRRTERQLSASFEIGCFHALLKFYEVQGYTLTLCNLENGAYRYLTAPTGNPTNFSYVQLLGFDGQFELRQQVRVQSHIDPAICFTPDMLVLKGGAAIGGDKNDDYAGGKRTFFVVDSKDVVAAHECKSTNVFPELLVSFLGMLVTAHAWHPSESQVTLTNDIGHLAPTLFVGGAPSPLHTKMISALSKSYKVNIIAGLHRGTWSLTDARNRLLWGKHVLQPTVIPY